METASLNYLNRVLKSLEEDGRGVSEGGLEARPDNY